MISQKTYWELKLQCRVNRVISGQGVRHSYNETLLEIQGRLYPSPVKKIFTSRNSWLTSQWQDLVHKAAIPSGTQRGVRQTDLRNSKWRAKWNTPAYLCGESCVEAPKSKREQPKEPLGPEISPFRGPFLCGWLSVIGNTLQLVFPLIFF